MNDYWEWLGRRAISLPSWEWIPGMMQHDGYRLIALADNRYVIAREDYKVVESMTGWPDFRDYPTFGGLLELARKKLGTGLYTFPHTGGYWCAMHRNELFGPEPTEAETLVDVLEFGQRPFA